MQVGTVRRLWRYPVKSMAGEEITETAVAALGLPGDRAWAVRDAAADKIRSAKKFPGLLMCAARSLEEPAAGQSHRVEVTLPSGAPFEAGSEELDRQLSALAGQSVSLNPLRPVEDLDAYRAAPLGPDPLMEIRQVLALEPDEPIPDFSIMPAELRGFASPPGTHVDAAHVHLLSTSSLSRFSMMLDDAADVRRFRPNFLLHTPEAGFPEQAWCGHRIRIGTVVLEVQVPTIRCAMTTHEQPGLEANPRVMRTLVRETKQYMGVYARVLEQGKVAAGDTVELLD